MPTASSPDLSFFPCFHLHFGSHSSRNALAALPARSAFAAPSKLEHSQSLDPRHASQEVRIARQSWKQMSRLAVLTVERGWRYGRKLSTGFAGRFAHAEEEPRLHFRGGALTRAGHRRQHCHFHHYQRGVPPSTPRRGALPPS